jgi:hypothetical protein
MGRQESAQQLIHPQQEAGAALLVGRVAAAVQEILASKGQHLFLILL